MKKKISFTTVALLVLISNAGFAQETYLNIGLGYALPMAVQKIGVTQVGSTKELVTGSYGKGLNFGATIGGMFNENIGAELTFSHLSGAEYSLSDTSGLTAQASGSMWRLIPALKFTAGKLVKPYAKFGVVVGISPGMEVSTLYNIPGYAQLSATDKYSGNSTFGMMGALGFEDIFSGKTSFFIEAQFIGQTWAPKVDNYSYTLSGSGITTVHQSGTITFVDVEPANPTNTNGIPDQAQKEYLPFSSIGFNIGVKFSFGGQTPAKIQK